MKRHAPAAARNAEPIAEVLAAELPQAGLVLEVASGTGEHAIRFARRFAQLHWQPSDTDDGALASIAAWREEAALDNLLPPLSLDACAPAWPIKRADAVLCINMVHISPWSATRGLFAKTASVLPAGAPLILYGPYVEQDVPTAPSNLAFDADLKMGNPGWGLREVAAVDDLARSTGFNRASRYALPANNIILVYRREPHSKTPA